MRFNVLRLIGPESKRFANLPDSYIKRQMEIIYSKPPAGPNYLKRTRQQKNFFLSMERPWTNKFKQHHIFSNEKTPHVEPILHWSFFRGDRVQILVGPDKGKQGFIRSIYQERNWVTVDGLHTHLRIINKTKDYPGMAVVEHMPLSVTTDIQHVDPSDLKPTKIVWKFNEKGEKVRVSERTGRLIPIPTAHFETINYKNPLEYEEGDKDTTKEDVEQVTFQPSLKTFEMDIMDKMGIVETRYQKPTYWY